MDFYRRMAIVCQNIPTGNVVAYGHMNDIRKESWGKRPLAKLIRDIYQELEIRKK